MVEKHEPHLRLVILSGPRRGQTVRPQGFDGEVRIGRRDPDQPETEPHFPLEFDLQVSRRHGRLRHRMGRWWLEDLGSKHGTTVDGSPLAPGPTEVLPGSVIKTGGTLWTFVPGDWLFLLDDEVTLSASCVKAVNYALYHCGAPLVGPMTLRNVGSSRSGPLRLGLEIQHYSDRSRFEIPSLDPGEKVVLPPPAVRLDVDPLRRQVDPLRSRLLMELGGARLAHDLVLLGFWDWSHEPTAQRTIAAFVSPRNAVVERIVWDAEEDLRERTGHEGFEPLLRLGPDDAERTVLESVYRCLTRRRKIRYTQSQLTQLPGCEGTYQTVRPPQRVFYPHPSSPEGEATCLDLAVLVASCVENVGLCPVIVLTGREAGVPSHAMAGCWIGSTPGPRAVNQNRKLIRGEIEAGNLLVVECTGVADEVPGREGKLSFNEALRRAEELLAAQRWVALVDVGAVRPPYECITPMDCPIEPEVARIYDEARRFARGKKRSVLETTHLLFGLLAVSGECTMRVFAEAGLDVAAVREALDAAVRTRSASRQPVPTWNYSEIQRLAESYAWQAGVSSVREQDVCWALLSRAGDSRRLVDLCGRIQLDLGRLRALFAEHFPYPQSHMTASGSYRSGPVE